MEEHGLFDLAHRVVVSHRPPTDVTTPEVAEKAILSASYHYSDREEKLTLCTFRRIDCAKNTNTHLIQVNGNLI